MSEGRSEGMPEGTLSVVGIGPGAAEHTTPAALAAIREASVVVGYGTYIKLVRPWLDGKEVVRTGMTEEIGRARAAIERARDGAHVVIISSGDAGVYGMAGVTFQPAPEMGARPRPSRDTPVDAQQPPAPTVRLPLERPP